MFRFPTHTMKSILILVAVLSLAAAAAGVENCLYPTDSPSSFIREPTPCNPPPSPAADAHRGFQDAVLESAMDAHRDTGDAQAQHRKDAEHNMYQVVKAAVLGAKRAGYYEAYVGVDNEWLDYDDHIILTEWIRDAMYEAHLTKCSRGEGDGYCEHSPNGRAYFDQTLWISWEHPPGTIDGRDTLIAEGTDPPTQEDRCRLVRMLIFDRGEK